MGSRRNCPLLPSYTIMQEDEDSDFLDFGGDSDEEGNESESSEDELDVLLNASPEERRQLQQRRRQEKVSMEDDFEREMNAELQERVTELEAQRNQGGRHTEAASQSQTSTTQQSSSGQGSGTTGSTNCYDDMYFDSDDEDNDGKDKDNTSSNRKRNIPSNDDLLYDPNMDDEDEKWVTQQRQRCTVKTKQAKTDKSSCKLPKSDAVLDCPACMTTLCRDCQRHDLYDNQYRAMFVSNCVVDRSELLKFPVRKEKKRRRRNRAEEESESDDKYNPVKCSECNTVVAMYDSDEIYHFFNVLASYS